LFRYRNKSFCQFDIGLITLLLLLPSCLFLGTFRHHLTPHLQPTVSNMDYLSEAVTVSLATSTPSGGMIEGIIGFVVAMAVLRLEVIRHAGDLPSWSFAGYSKSCRHTLRLYAPEIAGLAACLSLAAVLRVRGGVDPSVDEKAWAEIVRQWPMLLTADSLLSLQAMLRVIVLLSAVMRCGRSLPLSGEAAVFFGSAALARVVLTAISTVYRLDGPLGGFLPAVCELVSLPLSAILCRGISQKTFVASVVTILALAWIAYRNRLSLADDALVDGLFMFAQLAELLSAFTFLFRVLLMGAGRTGVAVRFAFIMMPLQQVLSAYYFVQAFSAIPELVGSGHPFELLQFGGVAQLGAYAGAAVLHVAEHLEMPPGDTDDFVEDEALPAPSTVHQLRAADADSTAWTGASAETSLPRAGAVRAAF